MSESSEPVTASCSDFTNTLVSLKRTGATAFCYIPTEIRHDSIAQASARDTRWIVVMSGKNMLKRSISAREGSLSPPPVRRKLESTTTSEQQI